MKKIIVFLTVLSLFTAYCLYESKTKPHSDFLELEKVYSDSPGNFDSFDNKTFLTLGQNDIVKIESNFIKGKDIEDTFINSQQLKKMKDDLIKLKVEKGVIISKDGSYIEYIFDSANEKIDEKDLVFNFSEKKLDTKSFKKIDNLDLPKEGSFLIYLYLNDSWYVYDEYNKE